MILCVRTLCSLLPPGLVKNNARYPLGSLFFLSPSCFVDDFSSIRSVKKVNTILANLGENTEFV